MDLLAIVLSFAFIALVIGFGIVIYKLNRVWKRDPNRSLFNLRFQIKEMNLEKANLFATRKNIFLDEDDDLFDAVELFLAHRLNVLSVVRGKRIIGVLTKKILVKGLIDLNGKADGTKVSSIMEKRFPVCEHDKNLKEVYDGLMSSDLGAVAILRKGVFMGMADYFDILNIFLNTRFEMENPPVLKDAMIGSASTIDPEESVSKLVDILIKRNADYAVVLSDGKVSGIVTMKDVLSTISKEENLENVLVRTIMSPRVLCLNPGNYVYEAMRFMVTRRYNQLPVVVEEELQGVVDLKSLVKEYFDYLSEIGDARNKLLVRSVVGPDNPA